MELKSVLTSILRGILFPFAILNGIVCIIATFILVPIMYIPFTVNKLFINLVLKFVIPGASILSIQDSIVAQGDFHKDRDMYVHLQCHFEGKIVFEDFIEKWDTRVMKKKTESGEVKFPEFKYYIDTFLGYFIRRLDTSFDLMNHLKFHGDPNSNSIIGRRELDKIVSDFAYTLFPVRRSPWQVLLVNNCRLDKEDGKEYSVVVVKIHHCLVDGYALIMVMWEALFQQKLENLTKPKMAKVGQQNIFKGFLIYVGSVFYALGMALMIPHYLILDRDKLFDKSQWHEPEKHSEYIHCTMRPIETSLVKEISANNKVSITTVLVAAINGGFRRMMEGNGLKSPKSIRMSYSLPLANHPGRLTTHSTVTYFTNKLYSRESEWTDKKLLQYNQNEMRKSIGAILVVTKPLTFAFASMPLSWTRIMSRNQHPFSFTTFCATVPLPQTKDDVTLLGCRMVGTYVAIGLPKATNVSTTVSVLKYEKHFFMNFGIQKHLLKGDENIYDIEQYVAEEILHLKSLSDVNKQTIDIPKSYGNSMRFHDSADQDINTASNNGVHISVQLGDGDENSKPSYEGIIL